MVCEGGGGRTPKEWGGWHYSRQTSWEGERTAPGWTQGQERKRIGWEGGGRGSPDADDVKNAAAPAGAKARPRRAPPRK